MNRYLFLNEQNKMPVSTKLKSQLKKCCDMVLVDRHFTYPCEISITFTDDKHIRDLNRQMRDIDRATDVLSFPQLEFDEKYKPYDVQALPNGKVILGDIVISLERADEQAREYGHSYMREVCFLCVHSMLHLLGYDHIKNEQPMFTIQKEILKKLEIDR